MIAPLLAFAMPGWPETIFILFIVVLLFGAKKIPELARGVGQSLGEFKKAKEESERQTNKPDSDPKDNEGNQPQKPV